MRSMRLSSTERAGYTLMEVMMVVAVVGVLASMAVPVYGRAVRRSHWQAGNDVLMTIYAGEQVARTRGPTYSNIWSPDLSMDDPNTMGLPIVFTIPVFDATNFEAYAMYIGDGSNACQGVLGSSTGGGRVVCPGASPPCPGSPSEPACSGWWSRP